MNYNPNVWGPHYWFFLHTITNTYPLYPNDVTKRKYYDLIINIPMFIPNEKIANNFSHILDKYPVTPYLDKKESFKKWMHFIHNKINSELNKEEISFEQSEKLYRDHYKPKQVLLSEKLHIKKHHLYLSFTLFSFFLIYILYKE